MQHILWSPSEKLKKHKSLWEGVSIREKTILCMVLDLVPFSYKVTVHALSRGQSIHHLTSLHHHDTAGRYKECITFKTFWVQSSLFQWVVTGYIFKYVFQKRYLFQKIQSLGPCYVIQEWSLSGVSSIKLHNNIICSISKVSLCCNIYAEIPF